MSTGELVRIFLCIGAAVILMYHRRLIADAIESFMNNFPRGGPPSPTHPLPGSDEEILRLFRRPR